MVVGILRKTKFQWHAMAGQTEGLRFTDQCISRNTSMRFIAAMRSSSAIVRLLRCNSDESLFKIKSGYEVKMSLSSNHLFKIHLFFFFYNKPKWIKIKSFKFFFWEVKMIQQRLWKSDFTLIWTNARWIFDAGMQYVSYYMKLWRILRWYSKWIFLKFF